MGKLSNALVSGLGDDCKIVIASGSVCVAYKNGVTLIALPQADSDAVTAKGGNPILAMCKTTFDDKTNVGIMNTMIIKGKARKPKEEEEESPKKGKKKIDSSF